MHNLIRLVVAVLSLFAWSANAVIIQNVDVGTTVISKNVISDFGATCDGVHDDAPAFTKAGDYFRSNSQVQAGSGAILNVPEGVSCTFLSCPRNSLHHGNFQFQGIPEFTLNIGAGTTMTSDGGCSQLGNEGFDTGNTSSNPFNTATAGSTCVTMQTPGTESNYPAGGWVIVGGIGMQLGSFPPNLGIFEFQQVASEGNGQVCFTQPLANTYKQTWFDWSKSGNFCLNVACGGPGYLYAMKPEWNTTFTVNGGIWNWDTELFWQARIVYSNNVTITGSNRTCYTPTVAQVIILNNNNYPNCDVEADKEVDKIIMNGGIIHRIIFQSSSIHTFDMEKGATVTALSGTPQNTICNNSTISRLVIGASYGTDLSFSGNNCTIGGISNPFGGANAFPFGGVNAFRIVGTGSFPTNWVYQGNGVLGNHRTDPPTWAVPGTHIYIFGADTFDGFEFTVGDNFFHAGVGGRSYAINTSISGANLPPYPLGGSSPNQFANATVDHMRNWNCTNCTGSVDAVDYSQAGAQGVPLWTYSSRTYTCTANMPNVPNAIDINNAPALNIWGFWGTLTIDVSTSDTSGTSPQLIDIMNAPGNLPIVNQTTGSRTTIGEEIDLAAAGTRTITTTSVTGAQTNDTLSAPGSAVATAGGVTQPTPVNNIDAEPASKCPVVTVTWRLSR